MKQALLSLYERWKCEVIEQIESYRAELNLIPG